MDSQTPDEPSPFEGDAADTEPIGDVPQVPLGGQSALWMPPGENDSAGAGTPPASNTPWTIGAPQGSLGGWTSHAPGAIPPASGGPARVDDGLLAQPRSPAVITRGNRRTLLIVLSAFALLCASGFAIAALARPDGAATPEDAVRHLFESLGNEDFIGVAESLPPSERSVLQQPAQDVIGDLQRLGILKEFDLHHVPGVDLDVQNLRLTTTNLGKGVSSVHLVAGTLTMRVIPDNVPIGPRLESVLAQGSRPPEIKASTDTEELGKSNVDIVTIEDGGGWHVSLFYSIAEAARGEHDELPVFGHGIRPVGAESPEAAVRALVDAGARLDARGAIAQLPPDEMRVLYDYGPLFTDDADREAQKARDNGFAVKVDRLDLRTEADGDRARVHVEGFDFTVGTPKDNFHASWDGTCVRYDFTSTSRRFSRVEAATTTSGTVPRRTPGTTTTPESTRTTNNEHCKGKPTTTPGTSPGYTERQLEAVTDVFGIRDGVGFTAVERGGRWYVSPTRTILDPLVAWLDGVSPEDLDRFIELFFGTRYASTRFEPVGGPIGTIPGSAYPTGTVPPTSELTPEAEACLAVPEEQISDCILSAAHRLLLRDPRFVDGQVIVAHERGIVAYEPTTSAELWAASCNNPKWASVVDVPRALVAVFECDGEYRAYEPRTGAELWRAPLNLSAERERVGPLVFTSQGSDGLKVYDVRTGKLNWSNSTITEANAVSDEMAVYTSDKLGVYAWDPQSGKRLWEYRPGAAGLAAAGGAVYARRGDHFLVRLNRATGAEEWLSERDPQAMRWTEIVGVSSHAIVLQATTEPWIVTAFDTATGKRIYTSPSGDGARRSMAGGTLFGVDNRDGTVGIYDDLSGALVVALPVESGKIVSLSDSGWAAFVAHSGGISKIQITRVR